MKRNGKYLIFGIIFVGILGCSIYYFNSLSKTDNYLDVFNLDKDNESGINKNYDNDASDNTNSENDDLELNEENDNTLSNNNSDSSNHNNNENDNDENVSDNDIDNSSMNNESNYFKELSVSNFISLIDNKDDFILVISQTWCSHCTNYKPKVEEVANNNKVVVYYIEYNMLSEDDKNRFNGYVEFLGTPTTVFYKDGVEIVDAKIEGDTTINMIESIFKDNGYIK